MSSFEAKRKQALEACEKVIFGIEDGTISVSSSLLMCMRIARLVNDQDGLTWLEYEYGGYPRDKQGYIVHNAWQIGADHGRSYQQKDDEGNRKTVIFTELCGELEATIESDKKAIGSYTTQGYSVSGDLALLATDRMTLRVAQGTNSLLDSIRTAERHLSILKSQYYEFATKWHIELQFGNNAKKVFEEYQEKVDSYYSTLPTPTLQKLNAIEDLMEDGNPEQYAQVLTSCRRLWSETAKSLFVEVLSDFNGTHYKTLSGKEIDVSGDHDNNKLAAVIETLQSRASKNTLVGSEIIYLIDWIEQINKRQNAGVHADVTREQAAQCIIHTYIALGDILSLKDTVIRSESTN